MERSIHAEFVVYLFNSLKTKEGKYASCIPKITETFFFLIVAIFYHFYYYLPGEETKGFFVPITGRIGLVQKLVEEEIGLNGNDRRRLYNYGCWCGLRGQGIVLDNID